jgi:26S proteasome regulatory subunit N3
LDYTEAYKCLIQAVRKCPQNTALGFRKITTKFTIIVQLLMGEIPEKSLFRQQGLSLALIPYFKLASAVRIGDLSKFKSEVTHYEDIFHRDKTYSLIQRYDSPFNILFFFFILICCVY